MIKDLEQEELYKYLDVDKSHGIQHAAMTQKKNSQKSRKKSRNQDKINSANHIKAINTLAIPVAAYSFNIINWTTPEIRRLDTKICKLLTCNRMHHSKADIDRLYIPTKKGRRE